MRTVDYSTRWISQRGSRPVRIANCSGYKGTYTSYQSRITHHILGLGLIVGLADPGYHMRYQAELGDVDFIIGDYLAEVNIAQNAEAHAAGQHPGWEQTCWDGIEQSIEILAEKRIKVIVNGGAHNPKGLAEKVQQLVSRRPLSMISPYNGV
jgi:hypothetical protein